MSVSNPAPPDLFNGVHGGWRNFQFMEAKTTCQWKQNTGETCDSKGNVTLTAPTVDIKTVVMIV